MDYQTSILSKKINEVSQKNLEQVAKKVHTKYVKIKNEYNR